MHKLKELMLNNQKEIQNNPRSLPGKKYQSDQWVIQIKQPRSPPGIQYEI